MGLFITLLVLHYVVPFISLLINRESKIALWAYCLTLVGLWITLDKEHMFCEIWLIISTMVFSTIGLISLKEYRPTEKNRLGVSCLIPAIVGWIMIINIF